MTRRHRDLSRATNSHLAVPAPEGLKYRIFQLAAIEYILKKFIGNEYSKKERKNMDTKENPISVRGVLIADEMGL